MKNCLKLFLFLVVSMFIFQCNVLADTFYFEGDYLKIKFTSKYGDTKGSEVVATYSYNPNYADGPAFQLIDGNEHYQEFFYSTNDFANTIILVKDLSSRTGLSQSEIPTTYGGTKSISNEEKKEAEEEQQKAYNIKYSQKGDTVSVGFNDSTSGEYITVDYKKCIDSSNGDIHYSLYAYMDSDNGCKVTDTHTYVSSYADNIAHLGAVVSFDCNNSPSGIKVECSSIEEVEEETTNVNGDGIDSNFLKICDKNENPEILAVFRLAGILLMIVKIVVPLLLILFGMIDLSKAVIDSKDDAIKTNAIKFGKRIVIGLIIFFVPYIVGALFTILTDYSSFIKEFEPCMNCILNPNGNDCPKTSFVK